MCFNTVNGRCCCFLIFVLPSLRSGTWDMRPSSSLCSSAISHPSAHTVNGRCCCNYSIDHQTGYDRTSFNTVNGRCCYFITFVLPSLRSGTWDVRTSSSLCSSAVSHPSTHTVNSKRCCNNLNSLKCIKEDLTSFNTVNGKHCYNHGTTSLQALLKNCVFQYRKR